MRTFSITALVAGVGLFTSSVSFAQELKCVSDDSTVSVSISVDGGEETMVVSKGTVTERYLVLFHDAGKIVAMNDSALGDVSNRGAILSLNTYGKNYLSYNGEILVLDCR
ncbi:MAG: hypothetical protein ACKOX6_02910 [Bdellovibrio sp.]